jgi:hypothetical protein
MSSRDSRTPNLLTDTTGEDRQKIVATHNRAVSLENRMRSLRKHMVDISDDPSGSDPAKYLKPYEVAIINNLVDLAQQPGVDLQGRQITLKKPWLPGFMAYRKPANVHTQALTEMLMFKELMRCSALGIGHTIGGLNQPVVMDPQTGLLYSQRGEELQRSKAIGYGRLPDAEILEWALEPQIGKGGSMRPLIAIQGAAYDRVNAEGAPTNTPALAKVLVGQIPVEYLDIPEDGQQQG